METALIAALVAGAVSLIGLLANLRIARMAQIAAVDQMRYAAGIKTREERIRDLKHYCVEIEKLRVRCWRLVMALNAIRRAGPSKEAHAEITGLREEISHQHWLSMDSWSIIKPELTDDSTRWARLVRHRCKDLVGECFCLLHKLLLVMDSGERNPPADLLDTIDARFSQLLDSLDKLISWINEQRHEAILSVWPDDLPNKEPEATR